MSSEQLADGVNPLDAELAATWDVLKGYSGRDTDLGIARRFGGSAAAYSLRDIGAMNGSVVRVRREPEDTTAGIDDEENFSANQVQSGALEDWVNGKLESTLPADVDTAAAAYSLRKVKADYGIPVTEVNGTDGFPATLLQSEQSITGTSFTVRHFSNSSPDSSEATAVNGVYRVSATKTSAAAFGKAIRIKGLEDGKQYTVKGEFRMVEDTTSGGDSVAQVDISDDTAGTDEDIITTTSTTFVPFFIDAGYNSGSNFNWVDFTVTAIGSETGTITAEFRNIQIIENNNSAVRIRRSSDDEEVVVGFDSDNKVSASSPVTATPSGSTTATTVAEFLSEERTTFITNPVMTTVSGDITVLSNTTSSTEFTFTFSGSTGDGFVRHDGKPDNLGADIGDTVSFDITASGLNQQCGIRARRTGANNDAISPGINNIDNGTQTITFTVTSNGPVGYFAFVNLGSASTGTIRVHNLKVVGKSAFVHTWYDQAGSNNAVQETDANQPLFAEGGALLADGLDFDGVNDYLEADGLSSIYTGTDKAHSSFVVVNSDAATTTQYILGIGSTSISNPLRNTLFHSGGNIGWQVRDDAGTLKTDLSANPYVANQTYLVSTLNSGTTIDFNTNSVINDNGTDADVGASTIDTVHIGTRANSPTGYLNGSIQELVFYASDQSANRFKIESNINNYYGLYNDANETNGNFQSADSNSSFSANGKDGFTATSTSSGTDGGGGIELNESVASGDRLYISFNSTKASSSGDGVALRSSLSGGTLKSQNESFAKGFNSFSLLSNGSDADFVIFRDDSGSEFTISDFKISRIARNGFVETWYDQSGNSNDAVQASAGNQPAIVQNGGLVTDGIRFETDNELETGGNITASTITGFVVANLKGTDANSLYSLGSDSSAAPSVLFGNPSLSYTINGGTPLAGGTAPTFANSLFTQLFISGGTSKSFIDGSQIASGDAGSNTASSGKITIGNLASSTRYANIAMNELIVFTSDKSTDQDEIEEDISRNYNITLS